MKRKHSLVVGGTRGIGQDLVKVLSKEGHLVSVIARQLPKGSVRSSGRIRYWAADITDPAQVSKSLSRILQRRGKLNYLVFLQRSRTPGDAWEEEIHTTLTATHTMIDQLGDQFHREASIVLTGSMGGHFVAHDVPLAYQVSKAGLIHMARYYAVLLGSKGIRVNSVSPGTILKNESKHYFLQQPSLDRFYKRMIPLNRMGTAAEVAQVIAFLCSPRSSFVTGQDIIVDGGLSVQWQETLALKLGFAGRKVDDL